MKSFTNLLLVVLFTAGSLITLSGCKNKCGTTTCQNAGTCSDNKCICPTGYTGNSCETAAYSAIIGTYDCSRADCVPSVSGVNAWITSITAVAGNGYQVNISNFDNGNRTVQGTVDSANNISIIPAAGTYGISATGRYVNGIITLDFTTSSAVGGGYHCRMTMKKK